MPAPSPVSAEPARIDALDGVRGLAILLVVLMHAMFFGVPLPGAAPLDASAPYPRFAALGWCGVDVFFVLSGFLITGILLRSKQAPHYFRNFYVRRALRIFPLYYVGIVLLLFVVERPAASPAEKVSYLLYYQNFHHALAGPHADPARLITWSLAIEEQFYLLWPAVVWLVSSRALLRICIGTIVVAIALRFLLVAGGLPTTHFLTPCRLDTLAAGALLAIRGFPPAWCGRLAVLVGIVGLVGSAAIAGSPLPESAVMQRWGLIAALAFAVGVLVMARGDGWFASLCRWRPLRSLGQYSYCVYLVHFLVIDWLAHAAYYRLPANVQAWLVGHLAPTPLLLLFTAACLLASWVVAFASWHLFEKWFLALKRHFPSAGATARV